MTEPAQNFRPQMVEDDTFDSTEPNADIRPGSGLDALQAALSENVRLDNLHLRVPRRPTLRIIVDPNIDGEQFQRWQRSAMIGKSKNIQNAQYDSIKLCAITLANTMVGLEVKDKRTDEYTEVRDSNGAAMTFTNPELKKMLVGDEPVISGTILVRKLFGNDGNLLDAAGQVMDAAGYGDDDGEEGGSDPLA